MGRSYGDTCLNAEGALLDMSALDRAISFDSATGVLRAEAGLPLDALLRFSVPRGWFLPTTPGTRFVTLAGAVANDVHGKNHHGAGCFGRHLRRLRLWRTNGEVREIGPDQDAELFCATVGGLGLTGVIEWIELQLTRIRSAYLNTEIIPFDGLDGFAAVAAESERDWPFTMAWVDCTTPAGRGLFSRASWASAGKLVPHPRGTWLSVPFEAPSIALNSVTLKAFNTLYYRWGCLRAGPHLAHYSKFFYPLDAMRHWNRLYGRNGMYQYQCVVPPNAPAAIAELLREVAAAGQGSFLAVLKTFGSIPSPGLLSFPREGTTLALDFQNQGSTTAALFHRLDAIVRLAGGRLYPAKDGRMPAAMFRTGYPHWERFAQAVDPGISSDFWRRVAA